MDYLNLEEALYGLEHGYFVEYISMSQAIDEIERKSILSPFNPGEQEALIELYGIEQVQLFIKRENKRIKKERKDLLKHFKHISNAKEITNLMVNLFG